LSLPRVRIPPSPMADRPTEKLNSCSTAVSCSTVHLFKPFISRIRTLKGSGERISPGRRGDRSERSERRQRGRAPMEICPWQIWVLRRSLESLPLRSSRTYPADNLRTNCSIATLAFVWPVFIAQPCRVCNLFAHAESFNKRDWTLLRPLGTTEDRRVRHRRINIE